MESSATAAPGDAPATKPAAPATAKSGSSPSPLPLRRASGVSFADPERRRAASSDAVIVDRRRSVGDAQAIGDAGLRAGNSRRMSLDRLAREEDGEEAGARDDRVQERAEDEDDACHNLTFDGVKEGPYMLCKHSDDLLGHYARQAFREKAASMRGENAIYYYLKELMKKHGTHNQHKKGLTSEQLVLDAHEFRKLIASDPVFQSAVPDDQVDALFKRMENENSRTIRHLDFVEFCLFDHNQLRLLLYKFRKQLKKLRLTDNEITDTFRRLSSNSSTISLDLLHSAISRELDVVLTTGELKFILGLMDMDSDGEVKINDFETFVKDDQASRSLLHPFQENGVIDVKVSINESDETNLRREGYLQLFPQLREDTSSKTYLWYKPGNRLDGRSAVAHIRYASTARDTELVSKGFTCLQQDINRGGAFGKHLYIWLSFVPPNTPNTSEVIDLCLSSGEFDDKKDARLWLPTHRGFKLVHGNLKEKNSKNGVFLWIRRRRVLAMDDLVDFSATESPRGRNSIRRHIDELELQVRATLRRKCPIDQDGSLNIARLFDEFDQKKVRILSKQAFHVGIESFGIKMNAKDATLVWQRINPCGKSGVDGATFERFIEMTESDIDEVVRTLQRTMTSKPNQHVPSYRLIFKMCNSLGDGRLSRSDFQRLLAENQLIFTNNELSKVMQRFDMNKDGVVDYSDFLRYVTGVCDEPIRRAQRVADAAEALKVWAIGRQNKKLARDGNIDSSAAWKLLHPKRGVVDAGSVDLVLRQHGIRLDPSHLNRLLVIIAPVTNGEICQAVFHAFVNHQPRKISSMEYDAKKVIGPTPIDEAVDVVFNRLNVEGNGRLSLVKFLHQFNALSSEKGISPLDLKDFVYLVQWTGADCGGDGAVFIDRFICAVRDNTERRNMKHEFVTNYDSPSFTEGVKLLRDEMRRCAKTPDGRFDFMIPFKLFDKDGSGQIMLSEFECVVRELGVDKYLNDQEVKSLMRRFDLNGTGGIDFAEFLRFNVTDASNNGKCQQTDPSITQVDYILEDIAFNEKLSSATAPVFCKSLKRTFGIIDKDTNGVVSVEKFVQTLRSMGIYLPPDDIDRLVHAYASDNGSSVRYNEFCDSLQLVCQRDDNYEGGESHPIEVIDLVCGLYRDYCNAQHKSISQGKPTFSFYEAFHLSPGEKRIKYISLEDLKEVLWSAEIRNPYLREELEAIRQCFLSRSHDGFNVGAFCAFMENGPSSLFHDHENMGMLDGHIARLQEEIGSYLATGKDAQVRLEQCFREFDEDHNGSLSHGEFLKVLQKTGLRNFLTPEDEILLLQFLDMNGDGVISYGEFVHFAKNAGEVLNSSVKVPSTENNPALISPVRPPGVAVSPPVSPPQSSRTVSPVHSRKLTSPAKSDTSRGSPRGCSPPQYMVAISRLHNKLKPRFPFEKYFHKYKLHPSSEPLIKSRVFEKIMDKFLARLIEHHIPYNMHEIDASMLARSYCTGNGKNVVDCGAFIRDLHKAHSRLDVHGEYSSASSSDGDLSCSSDEGESSTRHTSKLVSILVESIKAHHRSKPELEKLRSVVEDALVAIAQKKRDVDLEKKVYKLLARCGIRLNHHNAETMLEKLRTTGGLYDIKRLCTIISEQVGRLLVEEKSVAVEAIVRSSPGLSNVLADKMFRSFLAAAQHNISGRKLLEKCDIKNVGTVSVLEFQTVMSLLGCSLSEAELDAIKVAFSAERAGQVNYKALVQHITRQQAPSQKMYHPSNPQKTAAESGNKLIASAQTVASAHPSLTTVVARQPPKRQVQATILSEHEMKRIDSILKSFFSDLLSTRNVAFQTLRNAFEMYDIRGTGFVSPDAVPSVFRSLDVWLPSDILETINGRFSVSSTDKFNYVDFCLLIRPETSRSAGMASRLDGGPDHSPIRTEVQQDSSRPSEKVRSFTSRPAVDVGLETVQAMSTSRPQESWRCPICFHIQTSPTPTCQICAAQNPASVQYEMLVQCTACAFRNRPSASMCELCQLPLHQLPEANSEPPRTSQQPQTSTRESSKKFQLNLPTTRAPSYDEGWLA